MFEVLKNASLYLEEVLGKFISFYSYDSFIFILKEFFLHEHITWKSPAQHNSYTPSHLKLYSHEQKFKY